MSDASGAAWYLAAVQASDGMQAGDGAQADEDGLPETVDRTQPQVIIAISLDDLDDMTGDMLV